MIRKAVDWAEVDRCLGKAADRIVAKKFGISLGMVFKRRKKLGIPSFGSAIWESWDKMLGKVPDPVIAEKLSIRKSTVHARRKRLGIPSHEKQKADALARKLPVPTAIALWPKLYAPASSANAMSGL